MIRSLQGNIPRDPIQPNAGVYIGDKLSIRPLLEQPEERRLLNILYPTIQKYICRVAANGTLFSIPKSCRHYCMCKNGELIKAMCPKGYAFSEADQMCMPDGQVDCIMCPASLVIVRLADPKDRNNYYLCQYGIRRLKSCASGAGFDEQIGKCRHRFSSSYMSDSKRNTGR